MEREKRTRQYDVRSIGVHFSKRVVRKSSEVASSIPEAGDPTGGSVGLGDALDLAAKFGWRSLLAAESLRYHSPIDADAPEAVDDFFWNLLRAAELVATRTDLAE
ncbi:hypothetical protein [Bradyrhizobium ottawaense]|uniref:hypothetical protein n=1 Tax=Bradyrhizobium ottawaense TaxID=931866 RepID=UPI00384AFC8A